MGQEGEARSHEGFARALTGFRVSGFRSHEGFTWALTGFRVYGFRSDEGFTRA